MLRENLVVNNKDNRVFMSRNYRSDSQPIVPRQKRSIVKEGHMFFFSLIYPDDI